jgi:integrase/recombinase XerD
VATIAQPVVERRFEHLVLDFLAYLEFERGLSRNTLDAYRTDLLQFGRFLEERDLSALDAKPNDVADFLEELAKGGVARTGDPGGADRRRPRRFTARAPACARSTGTYGATGCSTPTRPPR